MEPLSAGASIITVLGAAAATKEGIQRLRALRHAQTQLDSLNNEVTDLELLLTFIKEALERTPAKGSGAIELASTAIREAETLIDGLKALIESNLVRRAVSNGSQANQIAIRRRGFLKAQRIQDFCVRFKDVREKLSRALMALTHLQLHANRGLPLVIEDMTLVRSGMEADAGKLKDQNLGHPIIPQMLENISTANNVPPTDLGTSVVLTTTAARRCAQFCPCQCHVRVSGQTPSWLQPFFGILFFRYAGTPIFNRRPCNLKKCSPSRSLGRFEYRFPTLIVPWILSVTSTWDNYGRPGGSWSLRTPNYITGPACGIISAFEYENVLELEKFMDRHGIPPWAEFTFNGWSLLHLAVAEERWDICEVLMERGSDLHHRASDEISIAMWAWHCILKFPNQPKASLRFMRYLEEADTLESLNFNIAHRIVTGLLPADLEEQLDLHPHFIDEKDVLGSSPLLRAVRCGNLDATIILLQRGSDVNTHNWAGMCPLQYAAWGHDLELCRVLLAAGADVNAFYASTNPKYRDVKRTYGEGYTALKYVADEADIELVKTLLEAGADPNIYPEEDDCTPAIFNFIKTDNVQALDLLCEYGADVNLRSRLWGYSAVMYAAQCNAKKCVVSLIEKGARLDCIGNDGASILHTAAANASVEIMHILSKAKIQGLPMDSQQTQSYWTEFDSRDTKYTGKRVPIEVECAAFLELLRSVRQVIGNADEDDDVEQYVDAQEHFDDCP